MIVEFIVTAFLGTLTWLLELLPQDDVDWPEGESLAGWIGQYGGPLDAWVPLSEFFGITWYTLTAVLPVIFIVKGAIWLWFMLPVIK